MTLPIEVISDVVCPWCYIGKRRLEKAVELLPPETEVKIRWGPFQLAPGLPPQGVERDQYLSAKFGSVERYNQLAERVHEAGQAEGIDFHFDKIQRAPNTFDAHRLIWLAERRDVQDAVVEALFRAYFVEGEDVGDRSVLARIATEHDIDAELLHADAGAAEVRGELSRARQIGVTGVPYFVVNNALGASGAQPPEFLAGIFNEALSRDAACAVDAPNC